MNRMHLVGSTPRPASPVWPSIAAASSELRRPRHLRLVSGSSGDQTRRERMTRVPGADHFDRQAG